MKKLLLNAVLLTLLICSVVVFNDISTFTTNAVTQVSGIIAFDTVWTKANSPYNLTGPTAVNSGVTLTIETGVIVNFNSFYIQVNGTIVAKGTQDETIYFNGGQITITPVANGWNEFTGSGCVFENANFNLTPISCGVSLKINRIRSNSTISINGTAAVTNSIITSSISVGDSSTIVANTIAGDLKAGNFSVIANNIIEGHIVAVSSSILKNTILGRISAVSCEVANNVITGGEPVVTVPIPRNEDPTSAVLVAGDSLVVNNTISSPKGGYGITISNDRLFLFTKMGYQNFPHGTGYAYVVNNTINNCFAGIRAGCDSKIERNIVTNNNGSVSQYITKYIGYGIVIGDIPANGYYGYRVGVGNVVILNNTIGSNIVGIGGYTGGSATIEFNLIIDNTIGIDTGSEVSIKNNTVSHNSIAIALTSCPSAIINYNNIQDYSRKSVNLTYTSSNIDATYNWWGTTDAQAINQTIYDFKSDFNLGKVDFIPYLATPNLAAPTTPTFSVWASAETGGSISPMGNINVNYGGSLTFTIAADTGYQIFDVLVDGKSVGNVNYYTFTNIKASHTIAAIFTSLHTPETQVGGIISQNTTWTLEGSPYIVVKDVVVEKGVVLAIEPGVSVKFIDGKTLVIDGAIIAKGNVTHPIIFTSNSARPTPGNWNTILLRNQYNNSIVSWCRINYGTNGLTLDGGIISIQNVNITNNSNCGINFTRNKMDASILNTIISNNGENGILIPGSGNGYIRITIANSTITSNGMNGVLADYGCEVRIRCSEISHNGYNGIAKVYSLLTVEHSSILKNGLDGVNSKSDYLNILTLINYSDISFNNKTGINIWHGGGNPGGGEPVTLFGNNITFNQIGVAMLGPTSDLQTTQNVRSNRIFGNSLYDFKNLGGYDINAMLNWWGSTNETFISQKIYDYYDDYNLGKVLYQPYLKYSDIMPPVTTDDYYSSWRNTDFTITLTATDVESGVLETFYRINNGPIRIVSVNGHPFITAEGANNTLEYWSVDNSGNEELPHKMLTQIKLDKTSPMGSVIINNGANSTTSPAVTLTLTYFDANSGVSQLRYSNDNSTWSAWESPTNTKAWTLTSGDGTKTVYCQIKDNAGNIVTYIASIILQSITPTPSPSLSPPPSPSPSSPTPPPSASPSPSLSPSPQLTPTAESEKTPQASPVNENSNGGIFDSVPIWVYLVAPIAIMMLILLVVCTRYLKLAKRQRT
ncbi:MAG: right-handed parallel beta-helix repeat-containing protein [Candidatus Bathyarchaeia archaeon]